MHQRIRYALRRAALALGMAWTLPNSAIGLVLGAVGFVFGARMRWQPRELALVVRRWPWGPGGALTLGNVMVHTGGTLDVPCCAPMRMRRATPRSPSFRWQTMNGLTSISTCS